MEDDDFSMILVTTICLVIDDITSLIKNLLFGKKPTLSYLWLAGFCQGKLALFFRFCEEHCEEMDGFI